ncbi:MAG: DNA primase [Acidobacteriota bacterium]|nr:DNA primase [Acidobacteriota bacterium]
MALGNVNLTPQFVQAVRDAVSIVDIASDHTRLKKAGSRYKGSCPLHKEKTPSFSVEPVQGLYYCFGCGQGGDAIDLHMRLSGDDFPAAVESLARRYGIDVPTRQAPRGGRDEPDVDRALEAAQAFFRAALAATPGPRRYLAERGFAPELVDRFGLGYAPPGWESLLAALRHDVPLRDLEAAGLVARSPKSGKHYDRFRERLMFPIHSLSGRLLGFGGRALDDDPAKYINTAETDRFHKGSLLYGMDQSKRALRDGGRALLVEGYFDLLGAVAAGIDWVVASMGTALTPQQARLLSRYAEEVYVGYDGDEAGERAAQRALPLLLAENLSVKRPRFGAGHDPDSLRREQGAAALVAAIEQAPDAVVLEFERLAPPAVAREPRRRAAAARGIAELLAPIRDGVLRYGYARQAADRLGVPVELLWRGLGPAEETTAAAGEGVARDGVVQSEEENVLHLLLVGGAQPAAAELPPPAAFFDGACRAIYEAWSELAARGERPNPRALAARVGPHSATVARLVQRELSLPAGQEGGAVSAALALLRRRWQRQRARELTAEIAEAERRGETDRIRSLLQEKATLSRALHPRH